MDSESVSLLRPGFDGGARREEVTREDPIHKEVSGAGWRRASIAGRASAVHARATVRAIANPGRRDSASAERAGAEVGSMYAMLQAAGGEVE